MRSSKLVAAIGIVARSFDKFTHKQQQWIEDEVMNILRMEKELQVVKADLNEKINSLFDKIYDFEVEYENPEISFEDEKRKSEIVKVDLEAMNERNKAVIMNIAKESINNTYDKKGYLKTRKDI